MTSPARKPQRPPRRDERPPAKEQRHLLRVAGLRAVTALFATEAFRVERLFYDERLKAQVGAFCAELARQRKPYRLVGGDELARVAGTVLHGGIVAVAQPRPLPALDLAETRRWGREGGLLLLLDGIGNPHNLGAIARSAAFFGVRRMILSDHPEQARPSDASYRIAEGGLEHLQLYEAQRFAATLRRLRESHFVLGAALGEGRSPDELRREAAKKPGRPFALVLGNEEDGLPQATREACEAIVTIPGGGPMQSLNVSASAAILLYALRRGAGVGAGAG
ncbi:MAG TPA: RNA methyltransferase [Alphaproteobacteria bacterium]|nr:RNA methyltransferase [Alphaproteobacteria bacterium]